MKTQAHGKYLIQLTRWFWFNCFFVREDDGFTLVDTGLPGSAASILTAAKDHGADIKRIAITHAHVDHIGSLDALAEALPQAEIYYSARSARFLAGDNSLDATEPQVKLRGGYQAVKTKPTHTLQADDRVGSLKVISAPGHTPGQIAFLDEREGTLLAGDAFQTQGGTAVAGKLKLLFPFPAFATWHKPTALQTAKALRALNPQRLAVGHGPVLTTPLNQMDEAIKAASV